MEELTKTDCNNCRRETKHKTLFYKKVAHEEFEEEVMEYMVVECAGCGNTSFLLRDHSLVFNEDIPPYMDHNYPEPDRDDFHKFLDDEAQHNLPRTLYDLYEEVKTAFREETVCLQDLAYVLLLKPFAFIRVLKEKI